MTDVLRALKHPERQTVEKVSGRQQAGNWAELETSLFWKEEKYTSVRARVHAGAERCGMARPPHLSGRRKRVGAEGCPPLRIRTPAPAAAGCPGTACRPGRGKYRAAAGTPPSYNHKQQVAVLSAHLKMPPANSFLSLFVCLFSSPCGQFFCCVLHRGQRVTSVIQTDINH